MSVENGTSLKLEIKPVSSGSYKPVNGLTSNSMDISNALRDVTTKDTGNFSASEYGLGEGSFSLDAKFDPDANTSTYYTYNDLLTAILNRDKLLVRWSDGVTGHKSIVATVLIESLPMQAPMHDNTTFSASLKWDGAPTVSTI